ncbi:TrkH family potassium uptake protein [Alienimonas chondri]|uniref:Trk system potassium uptake protein TrkH n=1 Tax=Alienimonas chondri TaxID=2681879 RepID=A0ABX1VAL1_9PLAN|nr:TrkH family potassium uptake protein [Alienimonas chondri]NNJ25108.1 Trk system potassium uptake protein TrkH [Alienimonas chondri]
MNWPLLCRLLGMLAMLVGGSMSLSLPWAFPFFGQVQEIETRGALALAASIAVSVLFGGGLWWYGRKTGGDTILRKEALAVVGLGWILAGVLGAMPLYFSGSYREYYPEDPEFNVRVTLVDAVFESVSGFSTTGASVLDELEDPRAVPRCVMFWRSFTHWLGGMGIIVLFVAILGQLGAGGKALMRREVPGPISEAVRPRVQEHALTMWLIYVTLSAVATLVYSLEGMSLYDALCHSFGTLATGGFSTYNDSVGHFGSLIQWTVILFMLLAGVNFSLYYLVLRGTPRLGEGKVWGRLKLVFGDPEFRVYLAILAIATGLLFTYLLTRKQYDSAFEEFRHAAFMSVAITTTTGFGTEDYTEWGESAKGLIFLLMFCGGCSGSTAGGIKVIRFMLLAKVVRLEVEKAFRPNVVRPMKLFGLPVDRDLRHDVVVYFALVLTLFVGGWYALCLLEPGDQWAAHDDVPGAQAEKLIDCASAVASCLNNIGPGLGKLGPAENYSDFAPQSKLLLTVLMLLGRLELFAILVLLAPGFWRVN